jgi:hypothetical protein
VEMEGVCSFGEIGGNDVKALAISIWMFEFCFWTWWRCETHWLLNMTNKLIVFFTRDSRNKKCWHDIWMYLEKIFDALCMISVKKYSSYVSGTCLFVIF